MTHLNSAPQKILAIGYCTDDLSEKVLREHGIDADLIWQKGRGVECLDYALRYFRGRPGVLAVAEDLRLFGDARKAIFDQVRELNTLGITVRDVVANDDDPLSLVERALVAKSKSAGMKNHRTARRRGSKGGLAKKLAAEATRNAILAHDIVVRLCSHPKLTKRDCAEILGPPFSLSTLIRNY